MSTTKKIGAVLRGGLWSFWHRVILRRNIRASGLMLLAHGARLQLDKSAKVQFGARITLEMGTLAAARKGAGLKIGNNVYLNRNCILVARESIVLEDGVTVGPNCCVYDHDHDIHNRGGFVTKPVVIKKNAWIGAGCIILKGVTIGENAVVAAGSVVAKDVPNNATLLQKRVNEYKISD